MQYENVESSQLHSIAHDGQDTGELRARFHCSCSKREGKPSQDCALCGGDGHKGEYVYQEVPRAAFEAIRDAKAKGLSTGKAFADAIKKPGYKFVFVPRQAK